MEGYLKMFVLKELKSSKKTGYELMQDFEAITGSHRPSPGTIYPLLNELYGKGLVTVSHQSNRKIYSISRKGNETLTKLMHERKSSFARTVKMLGIIYNPSEIKKLRKSLELMSQRTGVLASDFEILNLLKSSVIDFAISNNYKSKRKEFRKIIQRTVNQIMNLGE